MNTTKSSGRRTRRLPLFVSAVAGALLIGGGDLLAQTTPAPQPTICTRACWSATSNSLPSTTGLNRAIIHHTAGTYGNQSIDHSKDIVRAVQLQHKNQGWLDIGYHFLTDALGNVFQGRYGSLTSSTYYRGAHDLVNNSSYGYSALGNYDSNTFTTAGRNAMWEVIAWRMPSGWSPYGSSSNYGPDGTTVGYVDGHRNSRPLSNPTACPGTNVYNTIGTNYNGGTARNAIAALRTPGSGGSDRWHLKYTVGGGAANISFNYGKATDIPVVGDWNGNGTMTPGVVRGKTWYLKNSNSGGAADIAFSFGQSGDYPIVGDWNGNGKWTIGIVRGRTWHLRNTNNGGSADVTFNYGKSSDLPVVGDWNGNGQMTNGIVRDDRYWYLRNTLGGGSAQVSFTYGSSGDEAVVGDWNGNGQMTNGVRRGARWLLRNSLGGGGASHDFNYGQSSDWPIPGDWNGNGAWGPGIWRP